MVALEHTHLLDDLLLLNQECADDPAARVMMTSQFVCLMSPAQPLACTGPDDHVEEPSFSVCRSLPLTHNGVGQVATICAVDSLVLLRQALVAQLGGPPQRQLQKEWKQSCSDRLRQPR
jgi:hypothetical protein